MTRCRKSWRHRAALAVLLCAAAPLAAQELRLPLKNGSFKFGVLGDTGTGSQAQYDVGKQMAAFRAKFPFEMVIMVGDNIYGSDTPDAFQRKFEAPYKALLDAGVKFYAALGNHDNPSQNRYKLFNMGGQRFYTFRPHAGVRFFALDSNYMDKAQLDWLQKELTASTSEWKIPFFHHPLYSSGRKHGSAVDLRSRLEPLFTAHGVDVVFAGHDHFYERVKPQKGIYYFVSGAGGSLRKGNIDRSSALTAVGFDTDLNFMLVEIDGRDLYFQAVSRTGQTIDSGVIHQAEGHGVATEAAVPAGEPVKVAPVSPKPAPQPTPIPSPAPSPQPTPTPRT